MMDKEMKCTAASVSTFKQHRIASYKVTLDSTAISDATLKRLLSNITVEDVRDIVDCLWHMEGHEFIDLLIQHLLDHSYVNTLRLTTV